MSHIWLLTNASLLLNMFSSYLLFHPLLLQLDLESGTQQSIYGLHTDKEYEVRVRCKMSAFDNFGEFSDSIIVHVAQIPSKG